MRRTEATMRSAEVQARKRQVVRGGGLEPPRLSTYAPQTYVATNYTILANCLLTEARI